MTEDYRQIRDDLVDAKRRARQAVYHRIREALVDAARRRACQGP